MRKSASATTKGKHARAAADHPSVSMTAGEADVPNPAFAPSFEARLKSLKRTETPPIKYKWGACMTL
jgi:hypothetical protein